MNCPECSSEFKGGKFWIAGERRPMRRCPQCGFEFKEPPRLRNLNTQGYNKAYNKGLAQAIAICKEQGDEWSSDRQITHKNYAAFCAVLIERLKKV